MVSLKYWEKRENSERIYFLYIVDLKKKNMDILDFKCNGKN